jgi:uncharacterized protein YeaO (DUF488 family)
MKGIQIGRVYAPPSPDDGARLLVDRLWPRGIKKESLRLAGWLKEVAPSVPLCKWFGHDPAKWEEFRRRYSAELNQNPKAWQPVVQAAREGKVTLLFAASDTDHNNAVVLKGFLEQQMAGEKSAAARRPAKDSRGQRPA